MKMIMIATLLIAATSFAAEPPKTLNLKNGIVFKHAEHAVGAGLCSACHVETEGTPGKIPGFGKEWAHKTCIECHDTFDKGPTKCSGCHSKK